MEWFIKDRGDFYVMVPQYIFLFSFLSLSHLQLLCQEDKSTMLPPHNVSAPPQFHSAILNKNIAKLRTANQFKFKQI